MEFICNLHNTWMLRILPRGEFTLSLGFIKANIQQDILSLLNLLIDDWDNSENTLDGFQTAINENRFQDLFEQTVDISAKQTKCFG